MRKDFQEDSARALDKTKLARRVSASTAVVRNVKLSKSTRKGPITATAESPVRSNESGPKSFLDDWEARVAFNQLVNDKADERILGNLLQLRVIFGDVEKQEQPRLPPRRVIKSVSSKAISLADQLDDINRYPSILEARFNKEPAAKKFDWRRESPLSYQELLVRMLRDCAQAISGASSRQRPLQKAGGRNTSILNLLYYIKETTGRYHYKEVAALLNAVDYARTCSNLDEPRWDGPGLRQVIYRSRKLKNPADLTSSRIPLQT